jgi:uncharacterized protein YggE
MTSAPPHVAVHATAHRDVTPDQFEATVRVACRRATAGDAAQALTAGFARVEDALAALPGDLDVIARRSGVSQQRETWEGTPKWQASRSVTLTSRDVERAGAVLGPFAALLDVVDDLELHGPSWLLDSDNPVYAELQAEAVHRALARARRYAAALGATLGSLLELADPGLSRGSYRGSVALASGKSAGYGGEGFETMDFTPVPIEVEVGVEARWSLILP